MDQTQSLDIDAYLDTFSDASTAGRHPRGSTPLCRQDPSLSANSSSGRADASRLSRRGQNLEKLLRLLDGDDLSITLVAPIAPTSQRGPLDEDLMPGEGLERGWSETEKEDLMSTSRTVPGSPAPTCRSRNDDLPSTSRSANSTRRQDRGAEGPSKLTPNSSSQIQAEESRESRLISKMSPKVSLPKRRCQVARG